MADQVISLVVVFFCFVFLLLLFSRPRSMEEAEDSFNHLYLVQI